MLRRLHRLSNCFIVAGYIWATTRFKAPIFIRRSLHFKGLIPHFGVSLRAGFRTIHVVEYIPPKNKLWTGDNILVLFKGRVRVWEFRLVRCTTAASVRDALRNTR